VQGDGVEHGLTGDVDSMIKVYASEQKEDHQNYKSIYEANAEEFAMIERNSQYVPNVDKLGSHPD